MDIQILGAHTCESSDTKLVSLLIDHILALDAGGLTSSLSIQSQQKLKAILLTHQHYDHVRDIPTLAMNFFLEGTTFNIYSTQPVYDALTAYLLNDKLYPDFLEQPPQNPTIKFTLVEPYQAEQIEGYSVLTIPVNHSVPTVGYHITSPDGKAVFYTGDTGPGLVDYWEHISPQLLITEVTATNRYNEFAKKSKHLTPNLLKQELIRFQKVKNYLPQVVLVHMNPRLEKEIAAEIAVVAKALNNPIIMAYEGMQLHL